MAELLKNIIRGVGSAASVYPVKTGRADRFADHVKVSAGDSFSVDRRNLSGDFQRAVKIVINVKK